MRLCEAAASFYVRIPQNHWRVYLKQEWFQVKCRLRQNTRSKSEAYNCTDDEDDDDDDESLDVYDAALIWMSNGKDEDYTFGYTEEELEDALR